jgi:hypothetical protein
VLDLFRIDAYRADSPLSDGRFILFDDTVSILERERTEVGDS